MRDVLEAQLVEMGRFEWACEEFEAAAINQNVEKEFDPEGFRRIKGSRQLSDKAIAIVRALYLLRDKYAREMDMPPFKIMNNSVLLDLARNPPDSAQQMFKRPGISYRVARKFGWEIIRTISRAQSDGTSSVEKPVKTPWKGPSRETKARLEKLKLWRIGKANELRLHIGVVFPGNLLEILAAAPPEDIGALANIPGMRQWRVREFGAEILQALQLN
jgi:ribonuclease D